MSKLSFDVLGLGTAEGSNAFQPLAPSWEHYPPWARSMQLPRNVFGIN